MTAETPRRGRPARQVEPPAEATTEAVPPTRRRPRASAGGMTLKLDAPDRPGFVRRFVRGDPSRIQAMEQLGYALAHEPATEGKARTSGLGKRITRHAGTFENGSPMQAVLMETPIEEYAYGVADREDGRKQFEESIRRSAVETQQLEGAYAPGESSIKHSG